jgi:hypothetical protein
MVAWDLGRILFQSRCLRLTGQDHSPQMAEKNASRCWNTSHESLLLSMVHPDQGHLRPEKIGRLRASWPTNQNIKRVLGWHLHPLCLATIVCRFLIQPCGSHHVAESILLQAPIAFPFMTVLAKYRLWAGSARHKWMKQASV